MNKSVGLLPSSIVGLVLAIVATLLFHGSSVHPVEGALAAVFGVAAAVCGAAGLLGRGVASVSGILTMVFTGLAFALVAVFALKLGTWPWLLAGFVAYLVGATAFGFAAQAQGVKVGARTALLLLVLLTIVPLVDVVGLLGILITAIVRRNRSEH